MYEMKGLPMNYNYTQYKGFKEEAEEVLSYD